jgi:acetoin utilization deacetylase AcuC-like enzyme
MRLNALHTQQTFRRRPPPGVGATFERRIAVRSLLVTHKSSLAHNMGAGHPEQPDRLRAIERQLEQERFQLLARRDAPKVETEALLRVHPQEYLSALEQASPREGLTALDPDTLMCPQTLEAALYAAGGAVAAVDEVMGGGVDTAFVAVRPPGHHAGPRTPMGFCFLNNVAVAARHARAVHGAERVAIVDFDVHHGNGTQDVFWSDKNVLFCSTHQAPFYPGTGGRNEVGEFGTIVNAPLFEGSSGDTFLEALTDVILPRVREFAPQLILISAGFDAHERDPLGGLRLKERDFSEATKRLMDVADRRCNGRIVSTLEGGYNLDALGRSVAAHVQALMGA